LVEIHAAHRAAQAQPHEEAQRKQSLGAVITWISEKLLRPHFLEEEI
jgi:hypothetical protein